MHALRDLKVSAHNWNYLPEQQTDKKKVQCQVIKKKDAIATKTSLKRPTETNKWQIKHDPFNKTLSILHCFKPKEIY